MSVRCGFPNNTEYKFNPFPYSFPTGEAARRQLRCLFHVSCETFPVDPRKKTRLPKTFPAFPRRDFPFPKPCGIIRKAENAGGALLQSEPGAPPESGARGLPTASVVQYQRKSGKQRRVFRFFQSRGECLPAKRKQQETGRVSLWGKSLPSRTRRAVWEKPPRR